MAGGKAPKTISRWSLNNFVKPDTPSPSLPTTFPKAPKTKGAAKPTNEEAEVLRIPFNDDNFSTIALPLFPEK
jgi:hypothetical protein